MRNIFGLLAALMFMCISPAFADKAADEARAKFVAEQRILISDKDGAIEFMKKHRRDACALKSGALREACETLCDLIVTRRQAEKNSIELQIISLRLALKDWKDVNERAIPHSSRKAENDELNRLTNLVKEIYPASKKSQ